MVKKHANIKWILFFPGFLSYSFYRAKDVICALRNICYSSNFALPHCWKSEWIGTWSKKYLSSYTGQQAPKSSLSVKHFSYFNSYLILLYIISLNSFLTVQESVLQEARLKGSRWCPLSACYCVDCVDSTIFRISIWHQSCSLLPPPHSPTSSALNHKQLKINFRLNKQTWSRIHERTISLRFLGIILRVLRLEVSPLIS